MDGLRALTLALTVLAIAGLSSCGGESYDDVLRGLRNAALAKSTYNALEHADELEVAERAAIAAFCNVTAELAQSTETPTEAQYFYAIEERAKRELGTPISIALTTATSKLRATYDLATISGGFANFYVRACFR